MDSNGNKLADIYASHVPYGTRRGTALGPVDAKPRPRGIGVGALTTLHRHLCVSFLERVGARGIAPLRIDVS